jgi:hypothetical protein
MATILRRFLRIRPDEVTFARRRFHVPRESIRIRLERVGETFLEGYHAALAEEGIDALSRRLDGI